MCAPTRCAGTRHRRTRVASVIPGKAPGIRCGRWSFDALPARTPDTFPRSLRCAMRGLLLLLSLAPASSATCRGRGRSVSKTSDWNDRGAACGNGALAPRVIRGRAPGIRCGRWSVDTLPARTPDTSPRPGLLLLRSSRCPGRGVRRNLTKNPRVKILSALNLK
jgi:hypothetical protein